MKRTVKENNIDLNTLDLGEGAYNIRAQAVSQDSKNDSKTKIIKNGISYRKRF